VPLQTDPTAFSITALLADQVALVARSRKLPPGAASLLLRELMEGRDGRRHLLRLIEAERRSEVNPAEAAKIAVVLAETATWTAELDSLEAPLTALANAALADDEAEEGPARITGPLRRGAARRPSGIAWRRALQPRRPLR